MTDRRLRDFRHAGIALLCLTLAGCGFHLRGSSTVPDAIQPLAVTCDEAVPAQLCRALDDQLQLAEVKQAEPNQATAVLTISGFRQQRRANAITPTAAAAEYTLRQSVELSLISRDEIPLIATDRVSTAETYRYDNTNVLAKQREEDELQESLSRQLVDQILFRLTPLNQTRVDLLLEQNAPSDAAPSP